MSEETKLVQRTNLGKGEFSPSGVELARCYRRFYYKKMLGLSAKVVPAALVFGICVHGGVEVFYQLTRDAKESGITKLEIKLAMIKELTRLWVGFNIKGDLKRNLETGIIVMNNYCDRYFNNGESFKLEDIESDQWVPMPNGTMMLVKMDRVLNQSALISLVDTKTTSSAITAWFWKNFENHLPTSLYTYVVRHLLGRCDFVTIDAIKVPPPPANSKSEPFGRQSFIRTDLQIDDAVRTYCAITDYIMSVVKKPQEEWAARMFCNQGECDKYGGCEYLGMCKHGLTHPSVRVDFDIETPKWVAEYEEEHEHSRPKAD